VDEVDDQTFTGMFGEKMIHTDVVAQEAAQTATYVTGSLPVTASARPSFTSRRRCASASETAMFRDP
jgi:hypothetical protein